MPINNPKHLVTLDQAEAELNQMRGYPNFLEYLSLTNHDRDSSFLVEELAKRAARQKEIETIDPKLIEMAARWRELQALLPGPQQG